jgi:hypothetical protein
LTPTQRDRETTRQRGNKTTKQQNNKTTKQQNNKTTKQQNNKNAEDQKRKYDPKFTKMGAQLKRKPEVELLWAVDNLTFIFGVEKVSRSRRRNRDGLICWYSEWFPNRLKKPKILSNTLACCYQPFLGSNAGVQPSLPSAAIDIAEMSPSRPDEKSL